MAEYFPYPFSALSPTPSLYPLALTSPSVMPNALELLQDPEDLLTRFTLSTSNLFA